MGAGSGIDTAKLVDDLYNASRAPKEAAIKKREEANAAKISALGEASNALASFSSALSSLISGGTLFTQPTVSDPSILSAKALAGSRIGDYSATLEVKRLAQAQTLVGAPFANASDPVGEGTLTLRIGGVATQVAIGPANNSLEGLAKAINDKKAGVTASLVKGSTGVQLMLKGQTGAAQAFTLDVPGGTTSGLERFAYDPNVSGGLTRAQEARDAVLILDGVQVLRDRNSVSDLIPGMQLDLVKAVDGTTVTIGTQRPVAAIRQAVSDFVTAFNELNTVLKDMAGPGVPGKGAGPLRQDVGIRDMQRQLAQLPTTILSSQNGIRTLGDIGVRTNRDGSVAIDEASLERALKESPDAVEALFNPGQFSSNPNLVISSALGKVKPGTYTITDVVPGVNGGNASGKINGVAAGAVGDYLVAPSGSPAVGLTLQVKGAVVAATITIDAGLGGALAAIKDRLFALGGPLTNSNERLRKEADDLADARETMERRMTTFKNRLVNDYAAMEKRVSAFKATQSYLEQQVKIWTGNND
ncbi:flagellar filament capping protein FliD [Allosphingosinicella flava]|uniref:Flagellar hook-associated protein 2 n=1 Tax=Allosphingosinicella flava TaxID=2771430 RepID=A0A7T2GLV9_9SPHN|nr:flagellar filament capping protein FliD [Sphingosinicella flava]